MSNSLNRRKDFVSFSIGKKNIYENCPATGSAQEVIEKNKDILAN